MLKPVELAQIYDAWKDSVNVLFVRSLHPEISLIKKFWLFCWYNGDSYVMVLGHNATLTELLDNKQVNDP